jgi:CHAT domain-containing protein/tetratricopeptide (TPR) repeat protein
VLCATGLVLSAMLMASPVRALNPLWQATPELNLHEEGHGDLRLLEPGKPFDFKFSSSQTRSFQISLEPGQCLRLVVDHWGGDLDVLWYGPSNQKITEVGCRRSEPTPVTLVSEASGTHRLELRGRGKYPAQGRCQVVVKELRVATAKDKKSILAERAAAEAERLRWEWREAFSRRAIQKYEEALTFWRSAGEKREQAVALRYIGEVHQGLGRSREAIKYFHQALPIAENLKDLHEQGRILNDLGSAYHQLDERQKAIDYLNRALALSQQAGEHRMEAQALLNLAGVYHYLGDLSQCLSLDRRALSLWRRLGDPRGQAATQQSLGFAYSTLNDNPTALESFNQALNLWLTVGDSRGQALTLLGLGKVYSLMGERQNALNLFGQARPLIDAMGDPYWEAGLVNGLAILYDELGEKQKALESYEKALRLNRAVNSREGEAIDLWKIGRIYFSLGNKPKALARLQLALKTFGVVALQIGVSIALRDIGTVYASLGKEREALEYYHRALDLSKKGGFKRQEAITLNDIGQVHLNLGDEIKALDFYKQALSLHRAAMNPFGESLTLYNLAVLERNRGDLDAARSRIEAALKVVESLRGKVDSHELRSSYFASERQRYDFYIDLLMQMHRQRPADGFATAALEASERARARSLLDSLSESRANIREGADPGLLQQEQSLAQSLNARSARRTRLAGSKLDETESLALDKEIGRLTTEYQELQAQIRAKSPRYAALMQPQPLTLLEIQQQLLDGDSLLLEYALGDEHSYLWAVTPTSITSRALPGRAEVEKAARRVHELLIARQPKKGETAKGHAERTAADDVQYRKEAAALTQMLLGPVADQLGTKRLLIVAEGALQYLPFGALPKPKPEGEQMQGIGYAGVMTPLVVDHEIVNLPSASALAVLRREIAGRGVPEKAVAVLADPVFEVDDPRLGPGGTNRQRATGSARRRLSASSTSPSVLHRALRDVGVSRDGLSIPRLLSSRQEAEGIMAVVPEAAGMKAMDFRASRATATSPELGQYRIVHFATHGLLDSEHPELSGLVLSLVDELGQPQDGFLRLHDIYNLNLPADLVVLSACNTALGKEIRGEGLIGIVRGFMYAGAARVVASLWKVDDEATAELMKRFYQQMLQRGLKPAAALRAAQVDMQQQKRWNSPYYWAAFVLQGEWR